MPLYVFADMMTRLFWQTVGRAIAQEDAGVPGVFVRLTTKQENGPDYYWISTPCSVFGYYLSAAGNTVAFRYKFQTEGV